MEYKPRKYRLWYTTLIHRARERGSICGYSEKHHIRPRCLGGSNNKCNIVHLSFREHFLAHWLLTKMHRGKARRKMQYALLQMCRPGRGMNRICSGWQFDVAKRAIKDAQSKRVVSLETRRKLSEFRKGKPLSLKTRRKMRAKLFGNQRAKGNVLSIETRAKMSASRVGNTNTRGNKLSAKHRAAISAGLLRYYAGEAA